MNLRRFVFEYILIKGKVVALSSISLSRIEKRNARFHLEVDSDGVCARNTQIQVLSPLERWNSTTFIPVYGWFIVWTSYTWWFFLSCVSCIGSHSQHRNAHTRNERTWSRLQDSQMTECIVERTYWILHECTLKRAKHYKEMVKWVETVNKKKSKPLSHTDWTAQRRNAFSHTAFVGSFLSVSFSLIHVYVLFTMDQLTSRSEMCDASRTMACCYVSLTRKQPDSTIHQR